MNTLDIKGMAYIVYIPGEEKHYLCATGDDTFIRVEVDGFTLCRLATEAAHYLPKFLPGSFSYTKDVKL